MSTSLPASAPFAGPRLHGSLQLDFEYAPALEKTVLRVTEQTPPLKVVRAFDLPDGTALAHLHNISGGVLGGDALSLKVCAGPGSRVQLTTPGATRIYRHRPGGPDACQRTDVQVQAGALLEYLPDPLIPFGRARYRQDTRIRLAADAGLFWWETIAPGREAHGERFGYEYLEMTLEIEAGCVPIALERYTLAPQERPLSSLVRLGEYLYHTTFYICRAGVPEAEWLALEAELGAIAQQNSAPGGSLWGVSTLPSDGLVVRGFSMTHRMLPAQLGQLWQAAKWKLYGRDAILPRKVY